MLKLAEVLKFISPRLTDCSFRGALVNFDTTTPKTAQPRNIAQIRFTNWKSGKKNATAGDKTIDAINIA